MTNQDSFNALISRLNTSPAAKLIASQGDIDIVRSDIKVVTDHINGAPAAGLMASQGDINIVLGKIADLKASLPGLVNDAVKAAVAANPVTVDYSAVAKAVIDELSKRTGNG
jgi:hypothetical protein